MTEEQKYNPTLWHWMLRALPPPEVFLSPALPSSRFMQFPLVLTAFPGIVCDVLR